MKTKEKKPPIVLPSGKVRKELIGALLYSIQGISWPIEMRMINCLLKKHNDPDFWMYVASKRKFTSLKLLTIRNDIIFPLHLEYTKQKLVLNESPKSTILSEDKVGNDIIVQTDNKPKTLLDFLK